MTPSTASHTILLIRLSAIGDIVMASGLPGAIKQAYPNARVYWLVESPYPDLVSHHYKLDGVITWPKNEWRRLFKAGKVIQLFKAIKSFRKQLHHYNFSVAIDAQGLAKSAFLAKLSGASKRIGFKGKEGGNWLLTQTVNKALNENISSEYIGLAQELGSSNYQMHLQVSEKDETTCSDMMIKHGLSKNIVVCCPFTTRPQKHWPEYHWKTLLALLAEHNFVPVIIGGSQDQQNAQRLIEQTDTAISFAGSLSLGQSLALIEKSYGVIGVDTGMVHAGTAYSKPTIAIFGSTRPYTKTPSENTKVIFSDLACAPCKRKPTCDGRFDCMQNVLPQDVMNQFLSLSK